MPRIVHFLIAAIIFIVPFTATAFSLQTGYPQREGGNNRPIALPATATATATATGTATTGASPIQYPTTGFNRADCFDPEQKVRISLLNIPADTTDIEIWVRRDNTSCADPINRSPGGSNVQCWRAARWLRDDVVNKIVTFRPIQVIQAIDKQTNIDDNDVSLDPTTVCSKDSHMTPVLFYLQIMAFNSGTVVGWTSGAAGAVIGVPTAYDLAGPNPPTGLTVGAGNKLVVANFSGTSQPPADFDGYKVYCFPGSASGTGTTDGGALSTKADDAALSDGGTVDDASVEDATTTTDTGDSSERGPGCPTGDPFEPGELPSAEAEKYVCNSGNATAGGKITVSGLQNGVPYAVAIAARDKAGNSGVLSSVQCTTPKETDDFFTVYNRAGGTAGGGWCAIGTGRSASFGLAGFAVALAFLSRIARRSRR